MGAKGTSGKSIFEEDDKLGRMGRGRWGPTSREKKKQTPRLILSFPILYTVTTQATLRYAAYRPGRAREVREQKRVRDTHIPKYRKTKCKVTSTRQQP